MLESLSDIVVYLFKILGLLIYIFMSGLIMYVLFVANDYKDEP